MKYKFILFSPWLLKSPDTSSDPSQVFLPDASFQVSSESFLNPQL